MTHPHLLIDPFEKTITPVYYDGDFHSIYNLIDCSTFDVVRCGKYDLFVDDEGLFKEGQKFFAVFDYPQPLAGKALVAGCDEEGNTIEPSITIEELEARLLWVDGVIWEDE
jgi:hypothetical protein